jgi:hypothetical protein
MDGEAMNCWWATVPLVVAAAVPIWTAPSAPVAVIEYVALLLCALGIAGAVRAPLTAGCVVAVIGYAVALCSRSDGPDVMGSAIFGLALLFLLDLSEFARCFQGAEIAKDVLRAQLAYWLERAAAISGIVMVLALAGFVVSLLVPSGGRAIVAGLGALLAFAGTLYGASVLPRANREVDQLNSNG